MFRAKQNFTCKIQRNNRGLSKSYVLFTESFRSYYLYSFIENKRTPKDFQNNITVQTNAILFIVILNYSFCLSKNKEIIDETLKVIFFVKETYFLKDKLCLICVPTVFLGQL